MEQAKQYRDKLSSYKDALENFDNSMKIDLSGFDEYVRDLLMSGQIQKFEFSIDLLWKLLRLYLLEFHGIVKNSPKLAIKEFLNIRDIDEENYLILFKMIEDRNYLSHAYSQKDFEVKHKKLPEYLQVLKKVLEILENIK